MGHASFSGLGWEPILFFCFCFQPSFFGSLSLGESLVSIPLSFPFSDSEPLSLSCFVSMGNRHGLGVMAVLGVGNQGAGVGDWCWEFPFEQLSQAGKDGRGRRGDSFFLNPCRGLPNKQGKGRQS